MYIFQPEVLLVQDDILFVANKDLTAYLDENLNNNGEIISYELPTLWEMHFDNEQNEQLLLHIELPNTNMVSIMFDSEYISYLKENQQNIQILGILLDFNLETGDARNIIFITDIHEGLNIILKNE